MIRERLFFGLLAAIALLGFLAHYLVVGQATYGDGRFYYAYTHSLFFDCDLTVDRQLQHEWSPKGNNAMDVVGQGLQPSSYPVQSVGVSLLWLPGMLVGDLVSRTLVLAGFSVPLQGYAHVYQLSVGVVVVGLVVAGLWLSYRVLLRNYGEKVAKLVVVGGFLATNLLYYGSLDVLNTHGVSFFLAAAFFFLYFTTSTWELGRLWLMGLVAGLAFAVRQQDILAYLPFLVVLARRHGWKPSLLMFSGMAIGGFIQVYVWLKFFAGSVPLTGAEMWGFSLKRLVAIFVSPDRGVLWYSPLVAAGLAGLWLSKRQGMRVGLLSVIFQLLIISSWWAWDGGESYGIRMLISTYPLVFLGLGEVGQRLGQRWGYRWVTLAVALFILWNNFSIFRFMVKETGQDNRGFDERTLERIEWLRRVL